MTCIIGMKFRGKVFMGCDSALLSGWNIQASDQPKIFRVGDFLLGHTGNPRMAQLVQHHLVVRDRKDGEGEVAYLIAGLVPAMRLCLKEGGLTEIDNNVEEADGAFLVAYDGVLAVVYANFQVTVFADGLAAIGAGAQVAKGALATFTGIVPDDELDMTKAIKYSLGIAGRYNASVSGPYFVFIANGLSGGA